MLVCSLRRPSPRSHCNGITSSDELCETIWDAIELRVEEHTMEFRQRYVRLCVVTFIAVLAPSRDVYSATGQLATLIPVRARCHAPCARPALLFVHGVLGSSTTWLGSAGKSWPVLITMDKPFDDFDVYELDYLTHTETAPIRPTADAITTSAKEVIKPVMSRYRDVYVICHSLGGNVIRDYLTRIDAESPTELGRYRGLFLLGTPVEGSSLFEISRFVWPADRRRTSRRQRRLS